MPREVRELHRGEIYRIMFPYTFDGRYPNGKLKYVVVLQSGEYFDEYSTTVVLLITSNDEGSELDHVVEIEQGTTDLPETSYIECSQPYTIKKEIFFDSRVKHMGSLSASKMNEIDEAIYLGLCMGQQEQDVPVS
ncbi:type II toxin-antitoxin system PemK/MazF family toxin [Mesobacillus sp. S13]|uniref:type II toxin-antitoxin system PemK/MazF family toxin n=1 Tax=Mesobacillus sp. S13 TaxID=2880221 RepID=UPI001CF1096A|nr:type II toxin-antitoxin system PemK/MazF family toxin [Mesobacillus sp. S13]